MSEMLNNKNLKNEKPALDEHLYAAFMEAGSLQSYEYLDGDKEFRDNQKRKFMAGEIQNPSLDYPKINISELEDAESVLVSLKANVISTEKNELVRQVYRWRLNEKIAEIRLLKAVGSKDMHRFERYSEYIYGKPSKDIFAYSIGTIRSKAEQFVDSDNVILRDTAKNLLELMPMMDQPKITKLPTQETVEYAHRQTLSELGSLTEIPSESASLDAPMIQEAFELALKKIGDPEWSVVINEGSSRTGISTNQEQKTIEIPDSRTVTRKKLAALILHEIGTHAARRINGERSHLKLLGIGLDRYEVGEEGIATMREQALVNKVDDFRGIDGQLAIGLCLGLDGQPRDFRQVYEILEKYYLFKNLISKKELPESQEKAQSSAWNRTLRTFRGTDCNTPGACFTKDTIYRDGNIGIWDVIGNNPDEMLRFNIGKYDPANPRHIWILEQIGISDKDLSNLER